LLSLGFSLLFRLAYQRWLNYPERR
jgi:hypothetical protein